MNDAKKRNAFGSTVSAIREGTRASVKALDLVESNPALAAVVSKLTRDRVGATFDSEGNRTTDVPIHSYFKNLSDQTSQNISDAQAVMQMLPDNELAAQILISSILSPNDMMTTELTYMAPEGLLAPDVASSMVSALRQYFEKDYKIKTLLPQILRDMLFETGSYPVAVLPESSIDDIINGPRQVSMESFQHLLNNEGLFENRGILGPAFHEIKAPVKTKLNYGLESTLNYAPPETRNNKVMFTDLGNGNACPDGFLTVTDNFEVLKLPRLHQRVREERISKMTGSNKLAERFNQAMEAANPGELNDRALAGMLFKGSTNGYKPIVSVKTQDQLNRATVGEPLVIHFASESVIPVHVPGSPESHIGYFIMLDENGNPVSNAMNIDYYNQLGMRLNQSSSFASAMIQKVKANINGFDMTNRVTLDYATRIYGAMVERDLLSRLRNGIHGGNVEISNQQEIYRIMLSRTLAQQHTQLLYIPADMMTYFAFRYTPEGMGESLLDSMKILSSLRSMMMFTNVMAAIKNSIGLTEVKLKLDEHDPDPEKAIERVMHELLRTRSQQFPVGTNNPVDIADYLGKAGLEFTFEGHPGLPDVSIDIGEKTHNFTKPDTDLEDMLRKRNIMGYGLSPDSVDAGFQAEFATSITQNNLLFSKRVVTYQDLFHPQLQSMMRQIVVNSETILDTLRNILTDNLDSIVKRRVKQIREQKSKYRVQPTEPGKTVTEGDNPETEVVDTSADDTVEFDAATKEFVVHQILTEFINGFEVQLPQPSSATLKNQLDGLQQYTDGLEKAIDAYISSEFLSSDTVGDVSAYVDQLKAVAKAYFVRRYMAENGIYTELGDLITADEEGRPIIDVYKEFANHIEALTKSMNFWMKDITVTKEAASKEDQTRKENSVTSSGGSTGSDEGSGGDSEDDFGMGGDPYGLNSPDGESSNPGESAPDETADSSGEPTDAENADTNDQANGE